MKNSKTKTHLLIQEDNLQIKRKGQYPKLA